MFARSYPIIQAEFFNGVGKLRTMDDLLEAVKETNTRINEGVSLKTVVRFFDTKGHAAALVKKFEKGHAARDRIMRSAARAGKFRLAYLSMRLRWVNQSQSKAETTLRAYVVEALLQQLKVADVAIENDTNHDFRLVQPNEKLELQQRVERSGTRPWVFVFSSGDLLAEKPQHMVAHAVL